MAVGGAVPVQPRRREMLSSEQRALCAWNCDPSRALSVSDLIQVGRVRERFSVLHVPAPPWKLARIDAGRSAHMSIETRSLGFVVG